MSDRRDTDKKGNVIGLVQKKEEKLEPNLEVISLLERTLKSAKEGKLQEILMIGIDNEQNIHSTMLVEPLYDTAILGEITDLGYNYRDFCNEFWAEYEE